MRGSHGVRKFDSCLLSYDAMQVGTKIRNEY